MSRERENWDIHTIRHNTLYITHWEKHQESFQHENYWKLCQIWAFIICVQKTGNDLAHLIPTGMWKTNHGEQLFTTQNLKACTPLLKAGQEIAKISKWSEKEQKVPKGWELVKDWSALNGFIESLERIWISLRELVENVRPFPILAIGKDWGKMEFVLFICWKC